MVSYFTNYFKIIVSFIFGNFRGQQVWDFMVKGSGKSPFIGS